jgi:hypothetical protein
VNKHRTVMIEVACPDCDDRNREARCRCKRKGGMCKGTGRVLTSVPAPVGHRRGR